MRGMRLEFTEHRNDFLGGGRIRLQLGSHLEAGSELDLHPLLTPQRLGMNGLTALIQAALVMHR